MVAKLTANQQKYARGILNAVNTPYKGSGKQANDTNAARSKYL